MAPAGDIVAQVWGEVVADHVQPPGREAAAELAEEVEELAAAFAVAEPVEQLPGGQIEPGEHVPDSAVAAVGGPPPRRASGGEPAPAGTGLQVQRPELVHTDHPSARGEPSVRGAVVEVEDPGHLLGESRVAAGLPGLGGLPAHPGLVQDLADGLDADHDPVRPLE